MTNETVLSVRSCCKYVKEVAKNIPGEEHANVAKIDNLLQWHTLHQ